MSVIQWIKQQPFFNTSLSDNLPVITVDQNGDIAIAYSTDGTTSGGTNVGSYDVAIFKIDSSGNILWVQQQSVYNTSGDDVNPSISSDLSGNFYVTYATSGTTSGQTNTGSSDVVVLKLNGSGIVQWIRQQSSFNTARIDRNPIIDVDSNGNAYITYATVGTTSGQTLSGSFDIVVFKLDTNGNQVWIRQQPSFNTIQEDSEPQIVVDQNGNSYVTYNTTSVQTSFSYDIVVFKLDSDGNIVWVRQQPSFNTTGFDLSPTIDVDPNGNTYIAYHSSGTASGQTATGGSDIVVFKLDNNGNTLWVRQQSMFNTSGTERNTSIAVDMNGNAYVTYTTNSATSGGTFSGQTDIVVLQLNSNGDVIGVIQQPSFNTISSEFVPRIAVDNNGSAYITYSTTGTVSGQTNSGDFDVVVLKLSLPICLSGSAEILLADGSKKQIQNIQRGDIIINNKQQNFKVCKLCKETIIGQTYIDLMVFNPNSLGVGLPNQKLIMTPNHPIFYQGYRRPAQCFENFQGVQLVKKVIAESLLGSENGQSFLYDLQFEVDGSYIANGIEVQSRSPYSILDPLPIELYNDKSLYSNEKVWDSYDQELLLDLTILKN